MSRRTIIFLLLGAFLALLFMNRSLFSSAGDWERVLSWTSGDDSATTLEISSLERLRIDAWVETTESAAEKLQVIAGQWRLHADMDAYDAYDPSPDLELDATGFLGAIFDGRYIYFSPQHNKSERHGNVLRYDTHSPFHSPEAWSVVNAGNMDGLNTKGYYGGVFDGRYVYFTPRFDGTEMHSRVLRYDTSKPFSHMESWDAFDAGLEISYQGGGFDGQYVYFAPGSSSEGGSGVVLRYNIEEPFAESASWETTDLSRAFPESAPADFDGVAFDGTWIYLVPLTGSLPVRYDTRQAFDDPDSWQLFDASSHGMEMCVGATFDGRYIYYVPYDHDKVVRYDTAKPFETKSSWESYSVQNTPDITSWGYDGAFFDGRFIHFVPFFYTDETGRMNFHGEHLRYDTRGDFIGPDSWETSNQQAVSGLNTVGYNAGIFDGRYFYFAPWHDGEAYHEGGRIVGHSRVLRYDSLEEGTFLLRFNDYGHNGGLSGAVPGPSFTIHTDSGTRTVSADRPLPPGSYHIRGEYTGESLRLFIDGELVSEMETEGRLVRSDRPLQIGNIENGNAPFTGSVLKVEIRQ